MTSAGCPSPLTDTRTLWPSARSIAAQRTAVCRLPLRERAPAGVISTIVMLCLSGAMTPAYPDPDTLSRQLRSARERTRLLTRDLEGPQLFGPKLPIVNPVLWELGHVAWFQERWCLRLRADESLSESLLDGADVLYDSATVEHDTRWDLPLPGRSATLDYQDRVLERVLARLEREPDNEWFLYFVQLASFHEDMHAEAFHYTRQTLGYPDSRNGCIRSSCGPFASRAPPSRTGSSWNSCVKAATGAANGGRTKDGAGKKRRRPWRRAIGRRRTAPGSNAPSTNG